MNARVSYETAVKLHRQGRLADAEPHYRTALAAFPDRPDVLCAIGLACLQSGRIEEAVYRFDQTLAVAPADRAALMGLGEALTVSGRQEASLPLYQRLIAAEPGYAAAHYALGQAQKQLGHFAEATAAFLRAVAIEPGNPRFHCALAETAPFRDGDDRLSDLEALARDDSRFSAPQQAELHFALFKAYDELGRPEEAFAHLAKGNAIWRAQVPYDESGVAAFFRGLRETYTAEAVAKFADAGHASELPVFVVGMPRSGTTLVEQILASHPAVFGAGELQFVRDLIHGDFAGSGYPAGLAELGTANLKRFGGYYTVRLAALAPDAKRIVDKLPANFRHLGLIHLALPNARIIHLVRDPRDTCFSCYTQLFANGLNFAYDLGELGRYYRMADDLMKHWRTVLPDGAILDVQYEALITDFEREVRRLVAHCGLNWDDACLRFYETKRAVRTKSEFQVRRPIYASSLGRWKPYARHLTPLFDALGG